MASKVTLGNLNESALTQKVVLDAKKTYNAYPIKGGNGVLLIQNDYANVEVYVNGTNDFAGATKLSLTLRGKKWNFENIDGNLRIYDNFYIWTFGTSEIDIIIEVTQDAPNIDYYLGNSTVSESLISSVSQNAQNNITNAIEQTRQDFEIEGLLNIENLNVFISGPNAPLKIYLAELQNLEEELQLAYQNLEDYYMSIGNPNYYQFTLPPEDTKTNKARISFNKYLLSTDDYTNYRCPPNIAILTEWYQYYSKKHHFLETGNITFTYSEENNKYWYNHRGQINSNPAGACTYWNPNPKWCISLYKINDVELLKDKNQIEWLNETLEPLNATLQPGHEKFTRPVPVLLKLIEQKQADINKIDINNGVFTLKKRTYSNAIYIDLNLDIINTTPVVVDYIPNGTSFIQNNLQYSCLYALAKIRNISEYDLLIEGKTILNGNLQNLKPTEGNNIGFSKIAIELLDDNNYKIANDMINNLNYSTTVGLGSLRKNSIEYINESLQVKNVLDGIDITGDLLNINNLKDHPLSENTYTRTIKSGNEIGILFSFEAFGDKIDNALKKLRTINVNGGLSIKNKGVYIPRNTIDTQASQKNNK